ncbi:putative hemolysin [Methanocalculus sp. MC3]
MKAKLILVALMAAAACFLLAAGCVAEEPPAGMEVSATGTITYIDLEGGFFGIVTEKGTQYLPTNLAEELKVDGTEVTFTGVTEEDLITMQMWGTPIRITEIRVEHGEPSISGTGVITYIDLEGGFYGIITGAGTRYLPLNLAEEFKTDGLTVTFTATPEDVMTIQQWGQPVTIISISEYDAPLAGMANPAAVFVKESGYAYEIRSGPDGEYGVAILPDGTEMDEWEFYWQHHDKA